MTDTVSERLSYGLLDPVSGELARLRKTETPRDVIETHWSGVAPVTLTLIPPAGNEGLPAYKLGRRMDLLMTLHEPGEWFNNEMSTPLWGVDKDVIDPRNYQPVRITEQIRTRDSIDEVISTVVEAIELPEHVEAVFDRPRLDKNAFLYLFDIEKEELDDAGYDLAIIDAAKWPVKAGEIVGETPHALRQVCGLVDVPERLDGLNTGSIRGKKLMLLSRDVLDSFEPIAFEPEVSATPRL